MAMECRSRAAEEIFEVSGKIPGGLRRGTNLPPGRKGYVHVARGSVTVNGRRLDTGDALKTDSGAIVVEAGRGAEMLVFDLPDVV